MMKKPKTIPPCQECPGRWDSLFNCLNDEEVNEVTDKKSHMTFKKGQMVFHEGNKPQGLYCIHDGKVKVHKVGEEGREQIVRFAKQGDALGYRALLSDEPYNASATTLEDSLICFIPRSEFMEILQKNQNLSIRTIQKLTGDLKFAETRMINMNQKHVRERVADALLMLRDCYGLEEDGQTISAHLTRREIGNIAGTTIETAIRMISELKKEGIIENRGKKIRIRDLRALTAASYAFR